VLRFEERTLVGRAIKPRLKSNPCVMGIHTHHQALWRPLLTVSEAAQFLNVSRRQLYYLLEREGLPAVRVGARLRFSPSELEAFLERHREAGP
jgi:excisionase family DNA binding protein